MGHFLRCCLSSRLLVRDCSRVTDRNNIFKICRLLSTGIIRQKDKEANSPKSNPSKPTLEEALDADLMKFESEFKVSLPKSKVIPGDFVPGPDNSPEIFGTLCKKNPYLLRFDEGSEGDIMEDKYLTEIPNYLPQKEYVNMIKNFLKQRRFPEALDVVNVTMLKEHRIKPEYYIYAVLISYCGYTGYSGMAIKLYNTMLRRGLLVTDSVYTSLFNSFSNCPFPSRGKKQTSRLFSQLLQKGIEPNQKTCHAIVKAFGRCGCVEEAFKVVDYMMVKRMTLTPESMSFLFQACISDKVAGFRHALLVYRKMMQYCLKPDVIHFNLFLHCVRDCGLGDMESTIDLLRSLGVKNVDVLSARKTVVPCLDTGYAWEEDHGFSAMINAGSTGSQVQKELPASSEENNSNSLLPNLFSWTPSLGSVVSLGNLEKPQDRLFLLGGVQGFLDEMSKHGAKPDIKTISQLLACIPDSLIAEMSFLQTVKKLGLHPDLLFFNTLILRRIRRFQYSEAKEVLSLIAANGYQPDQMTYINLAMSCRTLTEAYELLKAMDSSNIRPSIELVTALAGCAVSNYHIKYVNFIFEIINFEEMEVNFRFIKKMDSFYEKCLRVLKSKPKTFTPESLDSMKDFCNKYPSLKENFVIVEEKHPWQTLRERQQGASGTDENFLNTYVVPNAIKAKFPRLGPTAAPKVRQAELKSLKEVKPSTLKRSQRSASLLNSIQGMESVTFQKLAPPEQ